MFIGVVSVACIAGKILNVYDRPTDPLERNALRRLAT